METIASYDYAKTYQTIASYDYAKTYRYTATGQVMLASKLRRDGQIASYGSLLLALCTVVHFLH